MKFKIAALALGLALGPTSVMALSLNTFDGSGNDCTGAMGQSPNCAVAWGGAVPNYVDADGNTVTLGSSEYLALPGYGESEGFSFQIGKFDWDDDYDVWVFTPGARYSTVTADDFVITGGGRGGTITYNPDIGDPTLHFVSVKQANAFVLNWWDGAADGEVDDDTLANLNRVTVDFDAVSHLTLLNGAPTTEIPLPGAVWLFGSALLGLVALGRRRFAA